MHRFAVPPSKSQLFQKEQQNEQAKVQEKTSQTSKAKPARK